MSLLLALAVACVASVPLTGGRLARLGDLRLRRPGLALGALGLQVLDLLIARHADPLAHGVMLLVCAGLGGGFLWANRRLPGLAVIGLGALANAVAMAANRGVMPASRLALRLAGVHPGAGFQNSASVAHPRLAWLGDVIPVPGPGPLANALSAGDVLIVAGLLLALHLGVRRTYSRPTTRSNARAITA